MAAPNKLLLKQTWSLKTIEIYSLAVLEAEVQKKGQSLPPSEDSRENPSLPLQLLVPPKIPWIIATFLSLIAPGLSSSLSVFSPLSVSLVLLVIRCKTHLDNPFKISSAVS